MQHALAGLAFIVLAAAPAAAQDRPVFAPTRDVTIDYINNASGGSGQGKAMKMLISAGGTRMRIEAQGAPGYMIMDRGSGRTVMVLEQQKSYAELPSNPAMANMFTFSDNMSFSRQGTDTVAGQKCTVWTVKRDTGAGVACITSDGLLMRGDTGGAAGGVSHIVATKVTFGALSDSVFQPPAGYRKLDMAAMPPGGAPHP